MSRDFRQIEWDDSLADDCRALVRLWLREDLGPGDVTTQALIPADTLGSTAVAARQPGTIAGLAAAPIVLEAFDANLQWLPEMADGGQVAAGSWIARVNGSAGSLLAAERLLLNFIGRLSGIATLTRQYVDAVRGTQARIYDTRKTTPGWRRLEKYAVRCGGGWNHRSGLFDAVLIKDNHLALEVTDIGCDRLTPAEAVGNSRQFLAQSHATAGMIVEVEVDTLDQLDDALAAGPDIVLLDNMSYDELRSAVELRNRLAPQVELEASGGVNLQTVATIALSGVERISVGALTHSAAWLDVALDWQ